MLPRCWVHPAEYFREYVQFIADRRREWIELTRQCRAYNHYPWMSETIDLGKEKTSSIAALRSIGAGRV